MSTEGIQLQNLNSQHTLVVHMTVPMAGMGGAVGQAFAKVYGHAAKAGVKTEGLPFARFFSVGQEVDFEAGTAVKGPVSGHGDVVPSVLPGGQACVAWHIGSYETAVETYTAMQAFMADHGKAPGPSMWEVYHSDPQKEPDVSKWRTQVFWPVL